MNCCSWARLSLNGDKDLRQLSSQLLAEQEELKSLFLLPQQEEMWLHQKIRPKWDVLLSTSGVWDNYKEEILQLVDRLEKAFWIVLDQGLAGNMDHLPAELKTVWPEIAYTQFSADNRSAPGKGFEACLTTPGSISNTSSRSERLSVP